MNPWLIASLWVGLALVATMLSVRLGVSVALVEIGVGVLAGNLLHLTPNDWVNFLAGFGSVLLTFLAGAEINPDVLRANLKESLLIGFFSFLAPALGAFAAAYWVFHWNLHAAQIAGIALSTTSVAVVYAVMVESGLNETAFVLWLMPRFTAWYFQKVGNHVSEPEIKFVLFILFLLGGLASLARSEAVLPAYLIGLVLARQFLSNRAEIFIDRKAEGDRLRAAILTRESLLICGPAGIGKTSLSSTVISSLRADLARSCFYLSGVKGLQDLLRQLLLRLHEVKDPTLRRQLTVADVSDGSFEAWLHAQPTGRLKGAVYRALEKNPCWIFLDHAPPLTHAVAKVVKELIRMRSTPVYLHARGATERESGHVTDLYWADRQRLALGLLPGPASSSILASNALSSGS